MCLGKKTKEDLLYLDSTIATKKDLEFIKFLRVINQILCDVRLFSNFDYDKNEQRDHFFSNNLDFYSQQILTEDTIFTYTEFIQNYQELQNEIEGVCRFIEKISPYEDRLRWDRLQLFNITLMVFLNSFGYEFQRTTNEKLIEVANHPRPIRLVENYKDIIQKSGLSKQKEFKKVFKVLDNLEKPINPSIRLASIQPME